jgi:hypothetical protein
VPPSHFDILVSGFDGLALHLNELGLLLEKADVLAATSGMWFAILLATDGKKLPRMPR